MLLLLYCCVANLLLQDTVERIHVGKQYGDIPRGIFLVRGENMVLCGEIVSSRETETESEREGERERERKRERVYSSVLGTCPSYFSRLMSGEITRR